MFFQVEEISEGFDGFYSLLLNYFYMQLGDVGGGVLKWDYFDRVWEDG